MPASSTVPPSPRSAFARGRSGAPARVVRSALVATVVAACATSAHVAAGGRVGPDVVAALALGAALAALALTGRRLTSGQLLGLLGLGQAALHVLGSPAAGHDASMLAAHGAATLASLLVLRHAEDVWWSATERVVASLRLRALTPVGVPRRVVVARPAAGRGRSVWPAVQGRAPPRAA